MDISSYVVKDIAPRIVLEETSPSACLIAGSTMIDRRAKDLLAIRLKGTRWDNDDDISTFETRFCHTVKETFTSDQDRQYLTIGSAGEDHPERGIKRGKLILEGDEVAALFAPSLDETQRAIEKQLHAVKARHATTLVAMVGGLSESVYFRQELQQRLGQRVKLYKPDEAT